MGRKVVRDDTDENMGRDVQVRDGFGATSPGIRMVPCWLVWRLYKPKSETKPIQYMSQQIKKEVGDNPSVDEVIRCVMKFSRGDRKKSQYRCCLVTKVIKR